MNEFSGRISEKAGRKGLRVRSLLWTRETKVTSQSPLRFLWRLDFSKTSSRQVSQAAWQIVFFSSASTSARYLISAFIHTRSFLDFLGWCEPSFDLSAYQTSYRSLPKLALDGWSVCIINQANANASQMGFFVDDFAKIGIVNRQQFWLVYCCCFQRKRELMVDKSET